MVYQDAVEKIKGILKNVSDLSITTDLWSSNQQESYISITVHWLDENMKMQNAVITTEEMPETPSGVNLKDSILNCLRTYGIEKKVVVTVADNGSNVVSVLESLVPSRLSCFAHSLQLGIKAGLSKVQRVKSLCASAKHLVKCLKKIKQSCNRSQTSTTR